MGDIKKYVKVMKMKIGPYKEKTMTVRVLTSSSSKAWSSPCLR